MAQLCRAISSHLRHVSTIGKNLLNSNISPTCPHNMVNFGLLAAEIGSLVWGPPANLNQFRVLAFLLQRRCSTEASRTLHNVWPSPKLVYCTCICIFVGSCPIMKFCQVQNSLCIQVLLSYVGTITARQSSSGRQPNFVASSRGRHLYWAGWPSRRALAHILVCI